MLEFYLGGARSGKSRLAESQAQQLAESHQLKLIYLATATADDDEMAERINLHQKNRSSDASATVWRTVEEPVELARTLKALDDPGHCIVVDCLTLWLTNLLIHSDSNRFHTERQLFLACLPQLKSHIIFVSNEVGQGVVPINKLARRFVDESGFLHQELARLCTRVVFSIAGLPQVLKGPEITSNNITSGFGS